MEDNSYTGIEGYVGEQRMFLPNTKEVPSKFSKMKGKHIETRVTVHPLLQERENSQLVDFYGHNLHKFNTDYGSAYDVLSIINNNIGREELAEPFVEAMIDRAKPGMSEADLHEGALNEIAKNALVKKFDSYLRGIDVNLTMEMSNAMLKLAKENRIFINFSEESAKNMFRDSMISYLANKVSKY
jgi:hypothetical protein